MTSSKRDLNVAVSIICFILLAWIVAVVVAPWVAKIVSLKCNKRNIYVEYWIRPPLPLFSRSVISMHVSDKSLHVGWFSFFSCFNKSYVNIEIKLNAYHYWWLATFPEYFCCSCWCIIHLNGWNINFPLKKNSLNKINSIRVMSITIYIMSSCVRYFLTDCSHKFIVNVLSKQALTAIPNIELFKETCHFFFISSPTVKLCVCVSIHINL